MRNGECCRDDRGTGMAARHPVTVIEIERRRCRAVRPGRPDDAARLAGKPEWHRSRSHHRQSHGTDGDRPRFVQPGCRRRKEIENTPEGCLPRRFWRRLLPRARDIGCHLRDDTLAAWHISGLGRIVGHADRPPLLSQSHDLTGYPWVTSSTSRLRSSSPSAGRRSLSALKSRP